MSAPVSLSDGWLERLTRSLGLLVLVAFAGRVLLMSLLYLFFGGREYTNDVEFHLDMASDPFWYFACRNTALSQQPPLLGALETMLFPLAGWFGPFFGVRIGYALWDLGGSVVLIRALARRGWDTPMTRLLLLFGPLNVYATAVSAQDEVIAWCFACICTAFLLRGHRGWAFLVACAGVLMAKILFVPVALMLAPFLLRWRTLPYLVLGSGLVAATYLWGAQCGHEASRLVLPADHTVNVWQVLSTVWLAEDWVLCFRLSFVCMVIVGGVQLLACMWRRGAGVPFALPQPVTGSLIVLLAFIGFFYHAVPEYFLVLMPLLLLRMREWSLSTSHIVFVLGLLLATPLVADVLRYFVRFDLGPDYLVVLHRAGCTWVTLMSLGLSCWLVVQDRRHRQGEMRRA